MSSVSSRPIDEDRGPAAFRRPAPVVTVGGEPVNVYQDQINHPSWRPATSDYGASNRPVVEAQAGHAAEAALVARDNDGSVLQGDRRDAKVHEADIQPKGLESCSLPDG